MIPDFRIDKYGFYLKIIPINRIGDKFFFQEDQKKGSRIKIKIIKFDFHNCPCTKNHAI